MRMQEYVRCQEDFLAFLDVHTTVSILLRRVEKMQKKFESARQRLCADDDHRFPDGRSAILYAEQTFCQICRQTW